MYIVKKKEKTANMLWDAAKNMSLCAFDERGLLETESQQLAERLRALGYEVSGEADLAKMTVAELKEYAAGHKISLGDAAKKDDILAAIKAAVNA